MQIVDSRLQEETVSIVEHSVGFYWARFASGMLSV